MKHDPHLANDLIIRSLEAKLARLEERVEALEGRKRLQTEKARKGRKAAHPQEALKAAPIIDRAARMNGCTVAEICGSRGSKRVILARAEAAHECMKAGMSSVATGRVLGGRDHTTVLNLDSRHRARVAI